MIQKLFSLTCCLLFSYFPDKLWEHYDKNDNNNVDNDNIKDSHYNTISIKFIDTFKNLNT